MQYCFEHIFRNNHTQTSPCLSHSLQTHRPLQDEICMSGNSIDLTETACFHESSGWSKVTSGLETCFHRHTDVLSSIGRLFQSKIGRWWLFRLLPINRVQSIMLTSLNEWIPTTSSVLMESFYFPENYCKQIDRHAIKKSWGPWFTFWYFSMAR
mgnify:CR=1 FL=1